MVKFTIFTDYRDIYYIRGKLNKYNGKQSEFKRYTNIILC